MDIELPKLHQEIIEHGFDSKVADDMIELIKPFVGYGWTKVEPLCVARHIE